MSERLTTALLRQVHQAAVRHAKMQDRLTEAMRARYGVTHSDVDCDWLIDALDYGGAEAPTLAEADAAMEACGAHRVIR